MFIEEVIPRWEREGREFLLNAGLASLAGENSRLTLRTTLRGSDPDWFELGIHLSAGGAAVRWNDLTAAASRGENYLPPAVFSRNFVRIPDALRRLAASLQPVVTYMPGADDDPDAEIIRIPRQAAYYWADAASELPGAVPVDFLRRGQATVSAPITAGSASSGRVSQTTTAPGRSTRGNNAAALPHMPIS